MPQDNSDEQLKADVSRRRGRAANTISDPQARRDYIAYQGRVEDTSRTGGFIGSGSGRGPYLPYLSENDRMGDYELETIRDLGRDADERNAVHRILTLARDAAAQRLPIGPRTSASPRSSGGRKKGRKSGR